MPNGRISQQEFGYHSKESKITFHTLFSLEKVTKVSELRHCLLFHLSSCFRESAVPSDCCLETNTAILFAFILKQNKMNKQKQYTREQYGRTLIHKGRLYYCLWNQV